MGVAKPWFVSNNVRDFVHQCTTCQSTKYETRKSAGLLQPLPVPVAVWEVLFLDFITRLPLSNGHYVFLVFVDHFYKAAHVDGLPFHFTTFKVA